MSLLGFEGFDENSSGFPDELLGSGINSSSALGYWVQSGSVSKNPGQLGGSALGVSTSGNYYCFYNNNYTRLIAGIRFRTPSAPHDMDVFYFGDGSPSSPGSSVHQCGFSIGTSKQLYAWGGTRGSTVSVGPAGAVLAFGSTTLSASTWYYFEFDVTFGASGSVSARINGSGTEFSATGVDTAQGGVHNYCNMHGITSYVDAVNQGAIGWYDDWYVLDPTTGSTPFTGMLGVCRVETLFPTSNDNVTWTPNASTNVSRIQETSVDGDTTYNSKGTSGQDTFSCGSLTSSPTQIFAVAARAVVRKDNVPPIFSQTTLQSGAILSQGVSFPQGSTYQATRDFHFTDPNTNAPWTVAAVNAVKVGYNRVTP